MSDARVAITRDPGLDGYPSHPPFSPAILYPEYPFDPQTLDRSGDPRAGRVYERVREALRLLDLDPAHRDTPAWNPLGEFIRPGDRVVIKPNFVMHQHGWNWDTHSVITHGSVLRAVLDYAHIALRDTGTLTIGDAPLQVADFARILRISGLDDVLDFHRARGVAVTCTDFRLARSHQAADDLITRREEQAGDSRGCTTVDLGPRSWLDPVSRDPGKFRVTCYDPREMPRHHNREHHEYLVANSILDADVVIGVPKLKTHRKVALTCALKNLVGINGHKDWLPHHRLGSAAEGGDEYLKRDLVKAWHSRLLDRQNRMAPGPARAGVNFVRRGVGRISRVTGRDPFFEGSWYGNDTAWRMTLDLNRILVYAGRDGRLHDEPQRAIFCLVDGIIAGEGEGPLEPTPRPVGLILAGRNPVAVDAVAARAIGFDPSRLPLLRHAFEGKVLPLIRIGAGDLEIFTDEPEWNGMSVDAPGFSLCFEPPAAWKGHVEFENG